MTAPDGDDLLKAFAEFLPRAGASSFELRYSEPEHDDSPTVWIAIASFDQLAAPPQVAAALSPPAAAFSLLEQLVDGGHCRHCHKPTGITLHHDDMPAPKAVCWYQYDPELKVFRRGCS